MDLSSSLLAIPVVDIDGTMFVQLGIYLLMVLILGPLLFKPWLAAQARRAEAVSGALAKSKKMRIEADALAHEYDAKLEAAREKAHGLRSAARNEEEATQAKTVAAAREQATADLATERSRIDEQAAQAREALSARVDELADEITTKLLGRAS